MATDAGTGAQVAGIPPHLILPDFLEAETADALYDYACAHEADFTPTGAGRAYRPDKRVSLGLRELGAFKPALEGRLQSLLPGFIAQLRIDAFELLRIELQLVAHGDGAFFLPHIDTATGGEAEGASHIRVLSTVYYFHRRPRAYEGGALRLYSFFSDEEFVDIEPGHNSLLVFPSWAQHEVRPVHVPSKRFADCRFAINGWFRKAR